MSKRKESSCLIDAMSEEERERKKQRVQNSRDSYARNVNRLAVREQELQHSVQNLEWKEKRLEARNRKLQVEQERERPKVPTAQPRQNPNLALAEILFRSFPSPTMSALSPGNSLFGSPSSTPFQPISPLPQPSNYVPFLCSQDSPASSINIRRALPKSENASPSNFGSYPYSPNENPLQPYIPQYLYPVPPQNIPLYIPSKIKPLNSVATNPIKTLTDRSEAYWRRLKIAIQQAKLKGKTRIQNPEDDLWFELKINGLGTVRLRIDGDWQDIEGGCKQEKSL